MSRLMRAIWLHRPDLQADFPLDTVQSRRGFVGWCLAAGRAEYRALEEELQRRRGGLLAAASDVAQGQGFVISNLMVLVWESRADLRQSFDLATDQGRRGLLDWYLSHGMKEYRLWPYLSEAEAALLRQTAVANPGDPEIPVTALMVQIWRVRPDLQAACPLSSAEGIAALVRWFFVDGVGGLGLAAYIDPAMHDRIRAAHPDPAYRGLPRIVAWAWEADADGLRARGDARRVEDHPALVAWLRDRWRSPGDSLAWLAPSAPAVVTRDRSLLPGVNLIGYAFGELGIGEDVRMAALACRAAGIPFSVFDFAPGSEIRQRDLRLKDDVRPGNPHRINLFCMTGFETARAFAKLGEDFFAGRYNIGYWPWELPEWPADWAFCFDLVDEIWASTDYTRRSFVSAAPVPVLTMPMAVALTTPPKPGRGRFGLPDDCFLFVFAFDFMSSTVRKNPEGAVTAFLRAFPEGNEPVGLVIKAMNAPDRPSLDAWMGRIAAADRRIRVIHEVLDRPAVIDLFASCDCFVSLHRAEGFGRGLAEAMLLEKPVVATAFSGNLDFTTDATAALVGWERRVIEHDDYPAGEGQYWAEPDLDEAAAQMRRVVRDAAFRGGIAAAGRRLVVARHGPGPVGAGYASRLRAIGQL